MTQTKAMGGTADSEPIRWVIPLFAALQILAASLPALGIGDPVGAKSDDVQTLVTPAGWAFSIWGLLYLGSAAFALFQLFPAQRDDRLVAQLRWPAAGAFLGNAAWATYVQLGHLTFVSVLIILFSLVSILMAYRRIAAADHRLRASEIWFAAVPLSALAAWLTAATIVNVAATLRFYGIDAAPDAAALIAALVISAGGAIAGLAVARGRGSPAFSIIFLWALAGIFDASGGSRSIIGMACGVAALGVVLGFVVGQRASRLGSK